MSGLENVFPNATTTGSLGDSSVTLRQVMIALRSSETSSTAVHHRWAMTLVVGTVGGGSDYIAMPWIPMGSTFERYILPDPWMADFCMANVATVNKPYMDP